MSDFAAAEAIHRLQKQNARLAERLDWLTAELRESRGRPAAKDAPTEPSPEDAWAEIETAAREVELKDRRAHNAPTDCVLFSADYFIRRLRDDGIGPEDVKALVHNSATVSIRLRQETLGEALRRERKARKRGLAAIKGDEQALHDAGGPPDPSCVEYGVNPVRQAESIVATGKRLGVLRR